MSEVLREWQQSAKYWERHAETIRTMFAPVTGALIEDAGIVEGDVVLDVAGGAGEPALTIAEVVGSEGSVVCTDAVGKMMAAAKQRASNRGLTNISFQQCLADTLPFESNTFDAVVSRLGVMFFPEPLLALREMLRVTKAKSSLAFAVWYESRLNPFAYLVTEVMSRYVESSPADPDAPGAFRFAERGKLARILSEAGAIGVSERLLEFNIEAPISRDEFWEMRSGTSGTLREKLDALPVELRLQVATDVKDAVADFFPNERMRFPAQMLIVTGCKK